MAMVGRGRAAEGGGKSPAVIAGGRPVERTEDCILGGEGRAGAEAEDCGTRVEGAPWKKTYLPTVADF